MSDPVRGGPGSDVSSPDPSPDNGGYMLIPVGEDVSIPVTVVLLGTEPDVTSGELKRLDWDSFRICIFKGGSTSPLEPTSGTRIIVTVGDRTKLAGRVIALEGKTAIVSRDPTHASDDRAAPRVMAVLTVRWRVSEGDSAAWVAGGPDPGPFTIFRGTADVSMSGIRFVCPVVVPIGARLMLDLELKTGSEQQNHRVIGIVRRVETLDGKAVQGGIEQRHAIGVEFLDLTEPALDALSDFTLENL